MRRTPIEIVTSVLLTSALVLGGPIPTDRAASARSTDDLTGSWLLELIDTGAPADLPTTPALATFFADGSFIFGDLPVRPASSVEASPDASASAEPVASPATILSTSGGQGIWTATGSAERW